MVAVQLVIKSPCSSSESRALEAFMDWTVLKVKEEIEQSWPDRPAVADQRLIYCGKMLQNDWVLADFLRLDDLLESHTMLLARPVMETKSHQQLDPKEDQTGSELRRRGVSVATSSRNANAGGAFDGSSQPQPPSHNHVWPGYYDQNGSHQQVHRLYHQMYAESMANYLANYVNFMRSGGFPHTNELHSLPNNQIATVPGQTQHHFNEMPGLDPVAAGAAMAAVITQGRHQFNAAPGFQDQGHSEGSVANTNVAEGPRAGAAVNPAGVGGADPANVVMNAGAGGIGAMEEDDEFGGGQRDALDWMYVAFRVVILFTIVYFYSSFSRFCVVAVFGLLMYLHRIGFFQRADNFRPANGDILLQNIDGVAVNEPTENSVEDDDATGENRNDEGAESERQSDDLPRAHTGILVPWYLNLATFVVSFFTSLMPNDPQFV